MYNGEKTISLTSGVGETAHLSAKNETRTIYLTMYKKKLKMSYRLKCKTRNHSRRKDNQYTLTSVLGIFFWIYLPS